MLATLEGPPITSQANLALVRGGGMADLSTAELAARLGVAPATISAWRNLSQPGKRYASRPFPEPNSKLGNSVGWSEDRLPEIESWVAGRPGSGGARVRRTKKQA